MASIDSVEKRYSPNWPLFVLALVAGNGVAALSLVALRTVFGHSQDLEIVVSWMLGGLLSLVLLMLLLATRRPSMQVRSGNNDFWIVRNSGDSGGLEQELDAFFQKVNSEVSRAKMFQSRTVPQ